MIKKWAKLTGCCLIVKTGNIPEFRGFVACFPPNSAPGGKHEWGCLEWGSVWFPDLFPLGRAKVESLSTNPNANTGVIESVPANGC